MTSRILLFLVLLGLSNPVGARADKDQAKRLAGEGAKKYQLGDYERALELFTKAYELHTAPKLLFNIAQCHKYLKNYERAIWAYESYLTEEPDSPDRTLVEGLIEKLKLDWEAEKERKAEEEKRSADKKRAEQRLEAARIEAERLESERVNAARLAALKSEPKIYERWWFWTILGVVVVGGTATAVTLSQGSRSVLPMGDLGVGDHR